MRPNAIYCSKACRSNLHNKRMIRTDENFRLKRNQYFKNWYAKNKEKHKKVCLNYYKTNREKWAIRRHANKVLKKEVFLKFDNKCNRCGCDKNLEMHHLNYDVKDGFIAAHFSDQIELLCRDCHRKEHRDIIIPIEYS